MQLVLFENYQNLDPFLSNYFDYKFKKTKYPRYQRFFLSSRPTISCEENEAFKSRSLETAEGRYAFPFLVISETACRKVG